MKSERNKTKTAIITLVLMLMLVVLMITTVNAQTPVPDRPTGAYVSVNPDTVGIAQPLLLNVWVYPSPSGPHGESGYSLTGFGGITGLHFVDLSITFTRPDGTQDSFKPMHGTTALGLNPGETDEVGTLWFLYYPDQTGTWSVQLSFPGNNFVIKGYSVYYEPSISPIVTFEVQQDPVQIGLPPVDLPGPNDYWERPIHVDYREWSQISGAFLGGRENFDSQSSWGFNQYSKAPVSPHILWTRDIGIGGIIGGEWSSISYSPVYSINPIVMDGKVYYNSLTAEGGQINCVDLRTGELIWQRPGSASQGQIAAVAAGFYGTGTAGEGEQYSVTAIPYLWSYSGTEWKIYNAYTGVVVRSFPINLTYVGSPIWLNEEICYVLRGAGLGSNYDPAVLRRPFIELIKWNSNKPGATWEDKIEWRYDLLDEEGFGPGEGHRGAYYCLQPSLGIGIVYEGTGDYHYAFDLDTGAKVWEDSVGIFSMPHGYRFWDKEKMLIYDSATMILHCYKITNTGFTEIWTTPLGENPWGTNMWFRYTIAYGNFYLGSYDGYMYCVNVETGDVEWKFFSGETTENPAGARPISHSFVADGKIYFSQTEHSPTQPLFRGATLFCLDAWTGYHIWNVSLGNEWIGQMAVAEGYLITVSESDALMYCFGKGRSKTALSASPKVISKGNSVLIEGSVTDQSPSATYEKVLAESPGSEGTACIADKDMGPWMNYLHMQRPEPMTSAQGDSWGTAVDVTGVPVKLKAVASDGSTINIGTTTSNMGGAFGMMWTPPDAGTYTIMAEFEGSSSYWPSMATTYLGVTGGPSAQPAFKPLSGLAESQATTIDVTLIAAAVAAVTIIAIAVIVLRRRN